MTLPRRRFTVTIDEIARDEPVGLRIAKQLRIYAELMEETARKAAESPILFPDQPWITRSDTVRESWIDPLTGATITWKNEVYQPEEIYIQSDFAG